MIECLCNEWKEELTETLCSDAFLSLTKKIEFEYANYTICPPRDKIFNALNLCKPNDVRVVILGQDPYFNPGQATGLAFSVNPSICRSPFTKGVDKLRPRFTRNSAEPSVDGQVPHSQILDTISQHPHAQFPPSLSNIIKEVTNEFGCCVACNGDLEPWARQGVLLLNTCLTVRQGACFSHKEIGWDVFINAVMRKLNERGNIIFVLWGANAKRFEPLITNKKNYILKSSHPSPLSAHSGFFGCGHFMKINEILARNGDEDIKW